MGRHWVVTVGLALAACAAPPREGAHPATPYEVAVAGALAAKELSHPAPREVIYAWRLELAGDRATYSPCTTPDHCTLGTVEVATTTLVTTKTVNRIPSPLPGASGDEVDVLQLTLARDLETTRGGTATDGRGLFTR